MAGTMVYRLRVADAEADHMGSFRNAVSQAEGISDNRGYNHIAGFHGAPDWYCWHHQFSPRTPLQARIFLPWHRAYLWWLEQSLQEIVQEPVALPWWDWTAEPGVPDAYAAPELNGEPNPLFKSRAFVPTANPPIDADTQRDPGANPQAVLPSADEIIDLLNDSDWASFSDRLEQFHDDVHVWVGGDMQDITTAAYDPIFFAHHCMVDRIWYLWQTQYGEENIPGALKDLELIPFGKRTSDVLSVQRLGYEYAAIATDIPINGATDSSIGNGEIHG